MSFRLDGMGKQIGTQPEGNGVREAYKRINLASGQEISHHRDNLGRRDDNIFPFIILRPQED